MCKCSELDWSQVDQTAEHHPNCEIERIQCRYHVIEVDADSQPLPVFLNDPHTKELCEKRFPLEFPKSSINVFRQLSQHR